MKRGRRVTKRSMETFFPDGGLHRRIVALPEYDAVYVKNLKAGCSTVTLWLDRIHTGEHDFVPATTRHREFRVPKPAQVGWPRVSRMLAGDAFRFTFVRDPVRRAESAYRDKIINAVEENLRDKVRAVLGLAPGSPLTLDQFVEALEAQEPLEMDPHWRPQYLNLMHPLISFDLVGRLESFESDLARVREACGFPDVPAPVRNPTSGRDAERLLDSRPDLVRRLQAVYARDYELYGY